MLIEFKVKNFRSIKEQQTLSLVASRDKKHPGNLIEAPGGLKLLKAIGIYGANASGKSNLIKAMQAMIAFIIDSATTMNVGDSIAAAQPFLLDSKAKTEPSSFALSFVLNALIYEYSFAITNSRVVSERLTAEQSGKAKVLFEREFIDEKYAWTCDSKLATNETVELLKERTRENGLAISRGAELNINPLTDVYLFFKERIETIDLSDPSNNKRLLLGTRQRALKDSSFKEKIRNLVQDADFGIEDISIELYPTEIDFVSITRDVLKKIWSDEMLEKVAATLRSGVPLVNTIRRTSDGASTESFHFDQMESNGTKRFFSLLDPWLTSLSNGGTIIIDELECSLHPLLARKLIQYFQHPSNNKNGAQLIFATQDSTLMDAALFRRDQLWLVEKNRQQASECFSLYDFDEKRPRNNEALQRNYLAGRYGGIPIFGRSLERVEDQAE